MKKVINIYGTARCGSTMMDLIIGNDPKGFSLGEVENWFHPYRTHHFDIKCGCGVYPCPVWAKIKNLKKKEFHEKALEILNVDFLVDSSKNLPWVIDNNIRAQKNDQYRAINVLLYKNPIALYYSHWKRGATDINYTCSTYYDYYIFIQANLPFISVNYDDFVSDPQAVLGLLCDIIGIKYFDSKVNFWEKTHHHLFGSSGTRRQLFEKTSSIYKENFSQQFKELIPNIEKEINLDKRLMLIMDKLHHTDIRKVNSYPPVSEAKKIRKDRNAYYRAKFNLFFKRFFPEEYPDKESEFITTYNC